MRPRGLAGPQEPAFQRGHSPAELDPHVSLERQDQSGECRGELGHGSRRALPPCCLTRHRGDRLRAEGGLPSHLAQPRVAEGGGGQRPRLRAVSPERTHSWQLILGCLASHPCHLPLQRGLLWQCGSWGQVGGLQRLCQRPHALPGAGCMRRRRPPHPPVPCPGGPLHMSQAFLTSSECGCPGGESRLASAALSAWARQPRGPPPPEVAGLFFVLCWAGS